MTLTLGRTLMRTSATLMLALAFMYLLHAAQHSALSEVPVSRSGAAVALGQDPFLLAEGQCGDGVAGCHFFCNHGCPVPPLPDVPPVGTQLGQDRYDTPRAESARRAHARPLKAPPRPLA